MASRDLKVTLLGDDKTGKAFGSASGGASKFGRNVAVAMAAVATAAAGAGVALFKIGSDFDKAYDTIRVGTGATGDALGALKDDFRDVVANVPTDFASASTAIADLNTRTGQTGEPLRQLSKQMLEMTRLTGGDLSANIASVTRVFGDWSVAAEDQAGTMDYLFKVSQTTGVGIDALSQKVVQFGAPLRQMGFDFESSAAMLGKWEKEGVNVEAVLSGMKIGLGKFSAAGKDPVKAMQAITESIKGAGSAGEANKVAIEAFGQRAGPDMAAAIREGRFDLDALMSTLRGSKETILGAAADTQDFGEKWTMLKNNVLLKLEPVAIRVFDAVGAAMDKFSGWWEKNGPAVMSTAASVRDGLVGAFQAVSGAVRSVVGFFREHETAAKTLAVVAGTVAAAVAAAWVAQATVATINAAKSVAAWFTTATASTTSATIQSRSTAQIVVGWGVMAAKATLHAAKVAAVWTATFATTAAKAIASTATTVARVVAGWVVMAAKATFHAAKMAAAWLIAMGPVVWVIAAVVGLVALVIANWDKVKRFTISAWNAVTGFISNAWTRITGAISNGISSAVSWVRGMPGRILGALGNLGALLWGAGGDLIRGFINGIKNMAGAVASAAKNVAKGAVNGVKSFLGISSPSKVFAQLGTNVGEGFVQGIAGMRPAVAAEMQRMADVSALKSLMPAGVNRVRLGDVSGQMWDRLRAEGWKGRRGDRAEALYRPAERAPAPRQGPTVRIENYNEARRSPHEVAEELTFLGRFGG